MSSLLDKAMAALLNENADEADKLFHEFVIQRAKQVNESVAAGQEVDIDAIVEGKSFKRGKDEDDEEIADKKNKDKERKDGAAKKRSDESLEEAANGHTIEAHGVKGAKSTKWRKTFKDEAALEAWVDANDAEVQGTRDLQVDEGHLTATQGDDGTLTIVHDPAGAAMAAPVVPAPMPVSDPMAAPVGDDMDDFGGDDLGMDDDFGDDLGGDLALDEPLPGIDDLNDEAFESLRESLASELAEITVDTKEGQTADGKKVGGEIHSPLPNVDAEKRVDGADPVETKGTTHNGFDKEPAPKTSPGLKGENVRTSATAGNKPVSVPKK